MCVVSIRKNLRGPVVREAVWSVACGERPAARRPDPLPKLEVPVSAGMMSVLAVSSRRRAYRLGPINPRPEMGSRSSPGSKRNVVLYPLFHAPDFPDQVGQFAAVLDEIDLRAVDHE